jgi:hypothetical protein
VWLLSAQGVQLIHASTTRTHVPVFPFPATPYLFHFTPCPFHFILPPPFFLFRSPISVSFPQSLARPAYCTYRCTCCVSRSRPYDGLVG